MNNLAIANTILVTPTPVNIFVIAGGGFPLHK